MVAKGLTEAQTTPQILQVFDKARARLFRNNVGCAKYGRFWVHYGVGGNGGPDWLGYTPVKITKEMVGHTIAVFTAVECKRENGGTVEPDQVAFITAAVEAGAIAGFARRWQQAQQILDDWRARFIPLHKKPMRGNTAQS